VQELGSFQGPDVFQDFKQPGQVVAVDGADIVEAHLLKEGARGQHALEVFLGAADQGLEAGVLARNRLLPSRTW